MNEEHKYEIVKFVDGEFELDVNVSPNEETIWLTIEEMSTLYNIDRTGISRHIKNIYKDGELDETSTCAKIAHMGKLNVQKYETKLYNLDVILAIGYRVNTKMGIIFRKWANQVLKEYNSVFLYQKVGYILEHYKEQLKLTNGFFEECKKHLTNQVKYFLNDYYKNIKYNSTWKLMAPNKLT